MFDYLFHAWPGHTSNAIGEKDFADVVARLRPLSDKLAAEVADAAKEEYDPAPLEPPTPPPPPTPLERHARLATWAGKQWSGSGISGVFHYSIRSRAALLYARRYLAEHGTLPEGTHRVDFTVGPMKSNADIHSPHTSDRSRLVQDITYPTAAPEADDPN